MEVPIKIFHCYHLMMQSFKNIVIYFKNFYWTIIALKYCVSFCCKTNQLHVYIYPLPLEPPSHPHHSTRLGHHYEHDPCALVVFPQWKL